MKSLAFVLLCIAACDASELDFPIQTASGGGNSSSFAPEPLPDAGPFDGGDGDGGFGLPDAGGLGPDATVPRLDSGMLDFFDSSIPPP